MNLGQILVLARTARSEKMTMRFHSLDRGTAESPHARTDLPPVGRSFDDALSVSAAATVCSRLNLSFVVALFIIRLSSAPERPRRVDMHADVIVTEWVFVWNKPDFGPDQTYTKCGPKVFLLSD